MIIDESNYLAHYGILRRSGRYPWGSGEDEESRSRGFLDYVDGMRKQGLSEVEIARGLGVTTTELRAAKSIAKNAKKQADIGMAQRLKDKGYSNIAIGQRMGLNESSVRALLEPGQKDKADILQATTKMLRDTVAKKKYIDVGTGSESQIPYGISATKLATAVAVLREEGYELHNVKIQQLGTGKLTEMKILCPPGTTQREVWMNRDQIRQITDFSEDGGRTTLGIQPPVSISSKRVAVRYAEQGGTDADGVIYVRPGVNDISLGASRYAQVRIAVDGSHYLKGMAMYKPDLPEGVDLLFNTNKSDTGNKLDAMKKMKDDPDNPFGATISRQRGVMNIVNEEGDWQKWSKSLSSQMLSKQTPGLARNQLELTQLSKKDDLADILKLTNPAVRRKLLESYADDADASAVHLKAAALPRQGSHVILPINTMSEHEIYAPNYRNGDKVVLIRYPHGGIFEIPELTVNNRHPEARELLGNARDAVGINHKVAARLSGADFDGDTVLVIPNNQQRVKTAPALAGLKGFDPQAAYPGYHGMKTMGGGTYNAEKKKDEYPEGKGPSGRVKGIEMGMISNLITDMTIKGAPPSELARAVRHSMVVIDAEKHGLNWRQSAIDNGIPQLKKKYQGDAANPRKSGAATLISRASSEISVPERKARSARAGGPVDIVTGEKKYEFTGATYVDRKGKLNPRTIKSKRLAETSDAHTLSSGTPIETLYANHSNTLKALANQARREAANTKMIPYSPSAKVAYSKEVSTLNSKLALALRNRPLERQAQVLANAVVSAKRQANPDMDPAELKKLKAQALVSARDRVGAKKALIQITPTEWDAIQAGAISHNKLTQILNNSDLDVVRKLATPKAAPTMTSTKVGRARAMLDSGHTQAEVADALGVSVTTLNAALGGETNG